MAAVFVRLHEKRQEHVADLLGDLFDAQQFEAFGKVDRLRNWWVTI